VADRTGRPVADRPTTPTLAPMLSRLRSAAVGVFGVATALALAACDGAPTADPTTAPAPSPGATTEAATEPTTEPTPTPDPTTASPTPAPPPPVPDDFASAAATADLLVAAERAIRDPDLAEEHLRGWAQLQHAAYRSLYHHPDRVAQVTATIPGEIRPAFDRNLHAQSELFALTSPREELPDWEIVPAPPAEELLGYYRAAAEEFGIDWTHLAAIHLVETRMGRIRGVSTAGALGPMQFMPATWNAYGEGDVNDPHDAIRAAARYLVAHGAPGDMRGALWAYNHSDRYVNAIEAYAANIRDEPATYDAYYHWRVYYRLVTGDVVLEEGWTKPAG
jgi:soluble lytic murein transglycosylase-like protein